MKYPEPANERKLSHNKEAELRRECVNTVQVTALFQLRSRVIVTQTSNGRALTYARGEFVVRPSHSDITQTLLNSN